MYIEQDEALCSRALSRADFSIVLFCQTLCDNPWCERAVAIAASICPWILVDSKTVRTVARRGTLALQLFKLLKMRNAKNPV